MKHRRLLVVLLAVMCFFGGAGFADESGNFQPLDANEAALHPSVVLSDILFTGDFRLSQEKVSTLLDVKPGDTLSSVDPEAVIQRFLKTDLFSTVRLEYELAGETARLRLYLVEKRTFLPIPMLYVSGDTQLYGLFIINANVFGTGTTAVTGGFISQKNALGLCILSNQIDPSSPGYQLVASFSRGERDAAHSDGEVYRTWKSVDAKGRFSLILPLAGVNVGGSVISSKRYDDAAVLFPPPDSLWVSGIIGWFYRDQHREEYFNSGLFLKTEYERGFPIEGERQWNAGLFSATAGVKLFSSVFFHVSASGELSDRPVSAETEVRGMQLLSGMTILTDRYLTFRASVEAPFARTEWGIFTLGSFYEGAVFRTGLPSTSTIEGFHGPGLSCTMYLKKVALPAIGITAGWNSSSRSVVGSAAIGMQLR